MDVQPLRSDLKKYLVRHNLEKKFAKKIELFQQNPRHPSLHTEKLEPRHLGIYSFRIDKKYRAIFVIVGREAEIIDINPHYE